MESVHELTPPLPIEAAFLKVSVVGAGAMGGYFAAVIAESGDAPVDLVIVFTKGMHTVAAAVCPARGRTPDVVPHLAERSG